MDIANSIMPLIQSRTISCDISTVDLTINSIQWTYVLHKTCISYLIILSREVSKRR